MYVVLAWFSDRPLPPDTIRGFRERLDAALARLVAEGFVRHDRGGDDWGLTMLHPPPPATPRWPGFAEDGAVLAVSMGLPVGLDVSGGPIALAGRLLRGEDVHADVVPPFGLLAVDGAHARPGGTDGTYGTDGSDGARFALQQDWLGMCRLFAGSADGVTVFASRPSLVPEFLGQPTRPDRDGWTSYAILGYFGGDLSPVHGVSLLAPGERVSGHRRAGGGWELTRAARFGLDDVVAAGIEARRGGLEAALDRAAHGLATTAASIDDLSDEPITLGLSGGKDSRLIAAAFIAGGRLPRFTTNEDTAAEGEVARRLVGILHDARGLRAEHQVVRAGTQAVVRNLGLRERVTRLQRLYDYQFPSSFTVRWPGPERLPATARPLSLTGAGGEVAVGSWYPKASGGGASSGSAGADERDKRVAIDAVMTRLLTAVDAPAVERWVAAHERDRLIRLLDHAESVGLVGLELCDYTFMAEHIRRRSTSAYFVGMVTPFLAPSFVTAAFALRPQQKREWALHIGLLRRFVPEWDDVGFVKATTGPSTAARVWDGDGLEAVHELLDTVRGDLTGLLRRKVVVSTALRCSRGEGTTRSERTLQQFAWLAVASASLEPDGVCAPTRTYEQFLAAARRADRSLVALGRNLLAPPAARVRRKLRSLVRGRRRTTNPAAPPSPRRAVEAAPAPVSERPSQDNPSRTP
jgi:hypothetical protein